MINSRTRIVKKSSIIDLITSNKDSNIKDTITIPTSLSDHFMTGCLRKLNNRKYLPRETKCCDYSNYNEDILIQRLTAVDWTIIFDCENVDNCAELLNDISEKYLNDIAPITNKRVKERLSPWSNYDVKKQMNARDKIYRRRLDTIQIALKQT